MPHIEIRKWTSFTNADHDIFDTSAQSNSQYVGIQLDLTKLAKYFTVVINYRHYDLTKDEHLKIPMVKCTQ